MGEVFAPHYTDYTAIHAEEKGKRITGDEALQLLQEKQMQQNRGLYGYINDAISDWKVGGCLSWQ
jgi:hypothetical protein